MTALKALGVRLGERRRAWRRGALTMVPVVAMTVGWLVVLDDRATAPRAELIFSAVATPSPAPAPVTVPEAVTAPTTSTPGSLRAVEASSLAARPSAIDIPDVALAAYQRAATVINATDGGCHLPWQLLAAIGRVESNHGRFAGSALDAQGVAQPAIIGVALNGHGTTRITDTDGGRLDGDRRFDRAVGPMQFIPSTWTYVGVDADGDGTRDPQDIDDAALAAAVYLCVGDSDLATLAGQRTAVHRYNHSRPYVDLVLSLTRAYQRGAFTTGTGPITAFPTTSQIRPSQPIPMPPPEHHPVATHIPHEVAVPVPTHGPGPPDPDPVAASPVEVAEPADLPTDDLPGRNPSAPANPTPPVPADPADTPTDPATPAPGASPSATPVPLAPRAELTLPSPEALCLEVGYTLDTAGPCVDLLLADDPGAPLPTPDELLVRLELAGVALPGS